MVTVSSALRVVSGTFAGIWDGIFGSAVLSASRIGVAELMSGRFSFVGMMISETLEIRGELTSSRV
jgi:hypothetical protein